MDHQAERLGTVAAYIFKKSWNGCAGLKLYHPICIPMPVWELLCKEQWLYYECVPYGHNALRVAAQPPNWELRWWGLNYTTHMGTGILSVTYFILSFGRHIQTFHLCLTLVVWFPELNSVIDVILCMEPIWHINCVKCLKIQATLYTVST